MERLSGDGGLHLFVEFGRLPDPGVRWNLLSPGRGIHAGRHFFTDGGGHHTMRLGFSRVSDEEHREGDPHHRRGRRVM